MRASETSSGQGKPGDQDPLLLCWGYVECGLNLAILGRMPGLHICSNLKTKPKITGRCFTQATPAGRRWKAGHSSLACPAWSRKAAEGS